MPSPEKRDGSLTGYWYGEVKLTKTNERFRRRFETKREAAGYEAYIKATGEEPEGTRSRLAGPTFKDTVILMRSKKKKKSTRDPSGDRRLDFLVDRFGHMPMSSITTTVLDKLVEDLERRPAKVSSKGKISNATINRYLTQVSGVFTWARDRDDTIPAPKIPWRSEAGRRIHWFSEDQEDGVCAFLTSQGRLAEALAVRVLCATGMRWSEFAGLEPHQCQPEWIRLDETKTNTPRDVPIDEELARELKAMVVSGTVPTYHPMRTQLKLAVKACGYSDKLGIHNMRHGTATRLIKGGVSPAIVQKFLGHSSLNTTMRYTHVENDDLMAASKKLSPRRGKVAQNGLESPVVVPFKSTG